MKERPILFSAPMVRALLAGAKTQTRRVVKLREFQPSETRGYDWTFRDRRGLWNDYSTRNLIDSKHNRYGFPGDRLWVRETHARFHVGEGMDRPVPECVAYRATCDEDGCFDYVNGRGEIMNLKITKWTPAIHMPRFASRLTLEVTGVRVERLQDISEDDARAEGIDGPAKGTWPEGFGSWTHQGKHIHGRPWAHAYLQLWMQINGHESAHANPWVWAITFKRVASDDPTREAFAIGEARLTEKLRELGEDA